MKTSIRQTFREVVMRRLLKTVGPLTAAVMLVVSVGPALAQGRALGEVVDVVGRVTVTRGGVTEKLDRGDELYTNDIVEATRNSSAEIRLGNGHHVKLRANTRVRIVNTSTSFDLEAYYGGVLAAINRNEADADGFRVSSRSASGAVRGTLFAAEVAEDGATTFKVLYGEVETADAAGESSLLLEEGTKTTVEPGAVVGEPVALSAAEISELEAWAGSLLTMSGVAAAGAADDALTTLTEGLETGGASGIGAGGSFPWVIVGAVGVVGITAAAVYYGAEDEETDDGSYINVEVSW